MKLATAALNQTPLDWNRNADNIRQAVEWVRQRNTMVLCLPELCISSLGCGPHFRRRAVLDKSQDVLWELVPELSGMIVTLGLPLEFEGHLFNAAALVVDGRVFGFQCKSQFSSGNLQELNWFRPWPRNVHTTLELNGQSYKIGDLSFEFNLSTDENAAPKPFHVAVEIGEPDWNAILNHTLSAPAAAQRQKLDLLLNPSASRFALEKHARRRAFAENVTKKHDYVHVFSTFSGNESGPDIFDGGAFVAARGKIVSETPRFSYSDVQVVIAELDDKLNAKNETKTLPALNRFEEFSQAVPLGMLDYLKKSGAKGFALSLSGGADSAALAVLVSLGVQNAIREIGVEQAARIFAPEIEAGSLQTPEQLVRRLLTCFYQSTKNSGDTTRHAARTVAESVGAEYHEIDIDRIVEDYVDLVSKTLGRELTWESDDLALQNIQARSRVPAAWLIANLQQKLLLATGNRSEATMGYTTMDGDTCGCLAPIGGIDKAFLRDWLRWLEAEMPFLSVINNQAPTAELRPSDRNQTDETDLMPYPVLNRVEQLGMKEGRTQAEILSRLREEFPEHDEESLLFWLGRFFRCVTQNQWKRSRYAMPFHLDDSTLSHDEWRCLPPLSGSSR